MPLLFLLNLLSICVQAQTSLCGSDQTRNSLFHAQKLCLETKLKKQVHEGVKGLLDLEQTGFCMIEQDSSKVLKKLCSDPNGFACGRQGKILDSQCRYMSVDNGEAEGSLGYAQAFCEIEKTAANRLPGEKAYFLKNKIYSPARIKLVRDAFVKVQQSYLSLITRSKTIPKDKKQILIGNIENTRLALDPMDLTNPAYSDCHDPSPGKANTAIFNTQTSEQSFSREIHFCIGIMANIDDTNPFDIIQILGHELSHSLDPCALEYNSYLERSSSPNVYLQFYPEMIKCLRGGTGERSCDNSILHCQSPEATKGFCDENYPGQNSLDCQAAMKSIPNCAMTKQDPSYDKTNTASFYKNVPPQEQIQESFADLMASEILADLIPNNLSQQERTDILLSISADNSKLHGICLKENTPDPHPPGYLRLNRIIMSNEKFRKAVGCSDGPPKTFQAGITCPGI